MFLKEKIFERISRSINEDRAGFFHRIGYVVLGQSSPLIIYAFTSLTTVALYGNYILIVGKVSSLLGAVFNSTGAAIGNLVASKDKRQIIKVFGNFTIHDCACLL